ncbi:MAG: WG repeat-containing protein, partial [Sulfurovaceae bacterium]
AQVKLGLNWGFVDKVNKEIIPIRYKYIREFEDRDFLKVFLGDKVGLYTKEGKLILEAKYDDIATYDEDNFRFLIRDEYDKINKTFITMKFEGKYGIIDKKGKEIAPPQYDHIYYFKQGLAKVALYGKWGYIDSKNRVIIPIKYDVVYGFERGGLCKVKLDDKYGYVNQKGEEIIPPRYTEEEAKKRRALLEKSKDI